MEVMYPNNLAFLSMFLKSPPTEPPEGALDLKKDGHTTINKKPGELFFFLL